MYRKERLSSKGLIVGNKKRMEDEFKKEELVKATVEVKEVKSVQAKKKLKQSKGRR